MTKTLTFLHTSPVHVPTFEGLLAEIDPSIPARHVVDESLLDEARAAGTITPALAERISGRLREALDQDAALVLCTCSTIGGYAERADSAVLRVDRPMAERAVALGSRILVAATVASTLEPTRQLILDAARGLGKQVQVEEELISSAWARFEQGDRAGYIQVIADRLREVASRADVIVLAQASMAAAAPLCADVSIPILSSPRLGLEAAVEAYHHRNTPQATSRASE